MFKDKKQSSMLSSGNNETVIAQGVRVEGDFHSQGNVIIDGEVTGSVETNGALNIGETARIHADIKAVSATVAGEIKGNIHTAEMLELLATSKVAGNISTNRISVAAGAQINGEISMGESQVASSAKTSEEEDEG
jgi:cytoskeletal protein CcmA (bactofilin family)